jgi:hypothetical protein
MRVLVACEFSGTVREAFKQAGHHAVSCDLLPTDKPGLHYQGDVRDLLEGWEPVKFQSECDSEGNGWCSINNSDPCYCNCIGPTQDEIEYKELGGVLFGRPVERPHWDLMIAHPPCTYLTNSAAWAFGDGPYHQQVKPGTLVGAARRAAREEAVAFVKALHDAPIARVAIENPIGALSTMWRKPDQTIQPWQFGHDASKATCLWLKGLSKLEPTSILPGGSKARRGNQTGQNKLPPTADRWKLRSLTYPKIAAAMAEQWSQE